VIDDLTYVMPLKWGPGQDVDELAEYLRWLADRCDVIVVDGSDPEIFNEHARAWGSFAKHVTPDADLNFAMGKVNGVVTGLRCAATDYVIIGDDDVRYEAESLSRVRAGLEHAEIVRPQNYFEPLPWHAAWDTGRTLLNRSFRADYPGTLGIRRDFFMSIGGTYDGDTMFENLELMRTVEAGGGTVASPLDVYVRRIPPDSKHFVSQRVRQAYDDLAQPARLGFSLALWPLTLLLRGKARRRFVTGVLGGSVAMAELGRRRAGGTRFFPWFTSWLAPAWLIERATCSWLAAGSRIFRGGIGYAGGTVPKAANSPKELRRRIQRHRESSRP
jgi:hypothetical protein